jgi:hypothetical protein
MKKPDDPEQITMLTKVVSKTGWWQAPDLPRYVGAPNILQYREARATELHWAMKKLGLKVVKA